MWNYRQPRIGSINTANRFQAVHMLNSTSAGMRVNTSDAWATNHSYGQESGQSALPTRLICTNLWNGNGFQCIPNVWSRGWSPPMRPCIRTTLWDESGPKSWRQFCHTCVCTIIWNESGFQFIGIAAALTYWKWVPPTNFKLQLCSSSKGCRWENP